MKVVVRRTGLSPHVIRMWEKRYAAVTPTRTSTRRRLYTDAEIQRLILLRKATQLGHSIGHIAALPTERLAALLVADETDGYAPVVSSLLLATPPPSSAQTYLDACVAAAEQLDAVTLETTLMRARVGLSLATFLDGVIVPLMQMVGELWREGALRIMHEHLASAIVRTLLGGLLTPVNLPEAAPHLIVTTPLGQLHEIGALIVAVVARSEGWRATYLGPNLPAEDIAAAVQQHHAQAVGLSIVYPPDDPHLQHELTRLHQYLPAGTSLFISGRAVVGYGEVLETIGALQPRDLGDFRRALEAIRQRGTS